MNREKFLGYIKNIIMKIRNILVALLLGTASFQVAAQNCDVSFLSKSHCIMRAEGNSRYVLLPVQESSEITNVKVIVDNNVVKTLNVKLATDNIDYYVPLDISNLDGKKVLFDFHVNGVDGKPTAMKDYACWKNISYADTFDTANREKFRPAYHHTPVYGWMNDPNGMFYKDGVYNLYYQYNPYGSQWENMTWGHSSSRDLVNWTDEGLAIEPDGLGTIFSGSCVVDKDNTAGFGAGAVVAFYTTAGENQTQSMAYSTDNGKTFTKYDGNPILTADVPDFRDPHVFRHEKSGRWILILAAGQEMRIYSSANLKDWTYESSFGKGYGCHEGVWECPDLFELPVEGKNYSKWVLVCNINPGGPAGGSATQYFTGTFDGHKFTCDTKPEVTKWADYGKDNYAGVTFDNAPDGRRIMIGWMSNWQYANQAPTQQYRSANTIARDLYLYTDGTTEYLASKPSVENEKMRGKAAVKKNISGSKTISKMFSKPRGTYEVVLTLGNDNAGNVELVLSNTKGENVSMMYDAAKGTLSFDRRKSGNVSFSDQFPAVSVAPVVGSKLNELRLYVDNCSVEAFANGGRSVMTNLVFPSEPYNSISVKCDGKKKSASLVVYPLNK